MFGLFKKKEKVIEPYKREVDNIKVSVIMPVYLGEYEGAAKDRVEKFKAAVVSFVQQTYKNKELIIVSDGCDKTKKIYKDCLMYDNVVFKQIDKQPLFSGNVRQKGLQEATGDVTCYLDSDDMLGKNHLQTIVNAFKNPEIDYIYYNDQILPPNRQPIPRTVELKHGSIGTSTIVHRSDLPEATWKECDGYGHDWTFIKKMLDNNRTGKKIYGAEYYVCHIKGVF